MADWAHTTVGELCRIKHGFAFKGEHFAEDGNLTVLSPGNFLPRGGLQVRHGKETYYEGEFPPEFLLDEGDLLIAMTDLKQKAPILGSTIRVPESGCFLHNQRLGLVTDIAEYVDAGFLYYLLNSDVVRSWLRATATGSTVRHTAPERIYTADVLLPPIEEQAKIAASLEALDHLIENNRRRTEILEEIARLIYREWFVHFRFPGHEDVELVDCDLGPIPEGWIVAVTTDLISEGVLEIGDGYRAKNSEFDGHEFAFVRVKNVRAGYLDLDEVDYLPEPYGEIVGGKCGRVGDCVISMKGTVGRMAFVSEATQPLIYSPQVSYWRSREPARLSPIYLRLWMQSPAFVEQCARVKGATDMADYVNLRDQRAMRLALPPHTVHAAFVESVSPLLRLTDNLRSQITVLKAARDLLLPRLISGELDVSDLDLGLEPVG